MTNIFLENPVYSNTLQEFKTSVVIDNQVNKNSFRVLRDTTSETSLMRNGETCSPE